MNALLLLIVLAADKPFDFTTKAEGVVVGARQNNETEIAALRVQIAQRDEQIEQLKKQLETEGKYVEVLKSQYDDLEAQHPFQITDLQAIQPITPKVQFVIRTSPSCNPCHKFIALLKQKLDKKWRIGDTLDCQFFIMVMTPDEWRESGLNLPHVTLVVNGNSTVVNVRDPFRLAEMYNEAVEDAKANGVYSDQVTSMQMATLQGKQQAIQFLNMLEPFLDGGTLQVVYTAKPGVVKEFLTIKKGSAGINIPPKTSFVLSMKNGDLDIKFQDPKPEVIIGPLERGMQEINVTPNKISLRLPWMIDPEIGLK